MDQFTTTQSSEGSPDMQLELKESSCTRSMGLVFYNISNPFRKKK